MHSGQVITGGTGKGRPCESWAVLWGWNSWGGGDGCFRTQRRQSCGRGTPAPQRSCTVRLVRLLGAPLRSHFPEPPLANQLEARGWVLGGP